MLEQWKLRLEKPDQAQVYFVSCHIVMELARHARLHSQGADRFMRGALAELLPPAQLATIEAELNAVAAPVPADLVRLELLTNAELTRQAAGQEDPPPLAKTVERKVLRGLAQALKPDQGNGGAVVPLRPVPPTNPPSTAKAVPAPIDF